MRGPRAPAALGIAAVAYVLAAWLVTPGFFDGFAPAAPYHWVSPPPDLRSSNQAPSGGRTTVPVQNGAAQAGHLSTGDQQASVAYPSQSFQVPAGGGPITLAVEPVGTYPDLGGIVPAGNVYSITASTPLISPVVVTLRYGSQQVGPPSDVFTAETPTSAWRSLGSINSAVPFTVAASTHMLGYFVVGFPPAAAPTPGGGGGAGGGPPIVLLVAVAAAVLAVLAALPVIAARRRSAGAEPEAPDARPAGVPRNRGGARRRRGRR